MKRKNREIFFHPIDGSAPLSIYKLIPLAAAKRNSGSPKKTAGDAA
jgi:hypothetical protein